MEFYHLLIMFFVAVLAAAFGTLIGGSSIVTIPTLILFKNGEVVDQVTGAVGTTQLIAMIEKALLK